MTYDPQDRTYVVAARMRSDRGNHVRMDAMMEIILGALRQYMASMGVPDSEREGGTYSRTSVRSCMHVRIPLGYDNGEEPLRELTERMMEHICHANDLISNQIPDLDECMKTLAQEFMQGMSRGWNIIQEYENREFARHAELRRKCGSEP